MTQQLSQQCDDCYKEGPTGDYEGSKVCQSCHALYTRANSAAQALNEAIAKWKQEQIALGVDLLTLRDIVEFADLEP